MPCAALLDRRLPDLGGLEACRQIRARIDAAVPIIVLSADHSPELQRAAGAAGITEYLRNPFDLQHLLARIAARLESQAFPADASEELTRICTQ